MGCTAAFVGGGDEAVQRRQAGKSIAFVANKTYQTECMSCHVGYLPGFLPGRSWKKLMGDLENHFGENASLDDPAKSDLLKYLLVNAADSASSTPRSKKIARMIGDADQPIRITETPFWKKRHSSVKAYVWKRPDVGSKAKCDSCHRDAPKGIYDEHDVHIPR
jgi:hypothetical protein